MRIRSFAAWYPVVEKKIPEPTWGDEGLLEALQALENMGEALLRETQDFEGLSHEGMSLLHFAAHHGLQKSLAYLRSKTKAFYPLRPVKNENDSEFQGANAYECVLLNPDLGDQDCQKTLSLLLTKEKDLSARSQRKLFPDWTLIHHAIYFCRFETAEWLLLRMENFKPFRLVEIRDQEAPEDVDDPNQLLKECAWEMFFTSPFARDETCLNFLKLFSKKFAMPSGFVSNAFDGAHPIHLSLATIMPTTLAWLLVQHKNFDLSKRICSTNEDLHGKSAANLLFHLEKISDKIKLEDEDKLSMWRILLNSPITNKKPLFKALKFEIKDWFEKNLRTALLFSLIQETHKLNDPAWFAIVKYLYAMAKNLPVPENRRAEVRELMNILLLPYVSFKSGRKNLSFEEAEHLMEEKYLADKVAKLPKNPVPRSSEPPVKKIQEQKILDKPMPSVESTSPSENIPLAPPKKEIHRAKLEQRIFGNDKKIQKEWKERNRWQAQGAPLRDQTKKPKSLDAKTQDKNPKKLGSDSLIATTSTTAHLVLRKRSNESSSASASVKLKASPEKAPKSPAEKKDWALIKMQGLSDALDCCDVLKNAIDDLKEGSNSTLKAVCNRQIKQGLYKELSFKKGSSEGSLHHYLIFLSQQYTLMKASAIIGYVFYEDSKQHPDTKNPVCFGDCREIRNRLRHPEDPLQGISANEVMTLSQHFLDTFQNPLLHFKKHGQMPLEHFSKPLQIDPTGLKPCREKNSLPTEENLIRSLVHHVQIMSLLNSICLETRAFSEVHFEHLTYLHNAIKTLIMRIGQDLRDLKIHYPQAYRLVFDLCCANPLLLGHPHEESRTTIYEVLLDVISHQFNTERQHCYVLFEDVSVSNLLTALSETAKIAERLITQFRPRMPKAAEYSPSLFPAQKTRKPIVWKIDAQPVAPPNPSDAPSPGSSFIAGKSRL